MTTDKQYISASEIVSKYGWNKALIDLFLVKPDKNKTQYLLDRVLKEMKDSLWEGWYQRLWGVYGKNRARLNQLASQGNRDNYPEAAKEMDTITQIENALVVHLPETKEWRKFTEAIWVEYPDFNPAGLFVRKLYLQGYIRNHRSNYAEVVKKFSEKVDPDLVRQTLDFVIKAKAHSWVQSLHHDWAVHFHHIKFEPHKAKQGWA